MRSHCLRLFGQISCFPGGYLDSVRGKLLPDSSAGMTLALALHVAFKCIEASTDRNLLGLANRQRQKAFLLSTSGV